MPHLSRITLLATQHFIMNADRSEALNLTTVSAGPATSCLRVVRHRHVNGVSLPDSSATWDELVPAVAIWPVVISPSAR
jgi:hypothetical protein